MIGEVDLQINTEYDAHQEYHSEWHKCLQKTRNTHEFAAEEHPSGQPNHVPTRRAIVVHQRQCHANV